MLQNQLYKAPSTSISETASSRSILSIGFILLLVFAFLRPITLTFGKVSIFGLSAFEIFGMLISYILLIPIIINFRNLRLDRMTLLSIYFCMYCVASVFWGSEVTIVARVILPFIIFLAVRIFITESKQIGAVVITIVLGYIMPIVISTYRVMTDRDIEMVEWWNKLERHMGVFSSSHDLAYNMFFFVFFCCFLNQIYRFKNSINKYIMSLFFLLSIYCLYQSHTRTVIIGFIIFLLIYLFGNKRKWFYGAMVLSIVAGIIFHSFIFKLIFKKDQIDLNVATSGRVWMLKNNIQLFLDSSFPEQLLGRGLKKEQQFPLHNDYIRLLISLGVFGLTIYLFLIFYLLFDIFLCNDKKIKYLFGALLISIAIMNFGSNAVVFRLELSQYFWLIMGTFYYMKDDPKTILIDL